MNYSDKLSLTAFKCVKCVKCVQMRTTPIKKQNFPEQFGHCRMAFEGLYLPYQFSSKSRFDSSSSRCNYQPTTDNKTCVVVSQGRRKTKQRIVVEKNSHEKTYDKYGQTFNSTNYLFRSLWTSCYVNLTIQLRSHTCRFCFSNDSRKCK